MPVNHTDILRTGEPLRPHKTLQHRVEAVSDLYHILPHLPSWAAFNLLDSLFVQCRYNIYHTCPNRPVWAAVMYIAPALAQE